MDSINYYSPHQIFLVWCVYLFKISLLLSTFTVKKEAESTKQYFKNYSNLWHCLLVSANQGSGLCMTINTQNQLYLSSDLLFKLYISITVLWNSSLRKLGVHCQEIYENTWLRTGAFWTFPWKQPKKVLAEPLFAVYLIAECDLSRGNVPWYLT